MLLLLVAACADVNGEGLIDPDDGPTAALDDGGEVDTTNGAVDYREQHASEADFRAMAEHAEAHGEVRVIVGLQVEFAPEGTQSDAANEAQREAIRREQERIVAALEGTGHDVAHRFASVPQIVLTLSPEAVEALRQSGHAASLQIDEAVPPG